MCAPCSAVRILSVCSPVAGQKEKAPAASGMCRQPLSVRLSVCPGQAASVKPCASPLGRGLGGQRPARRRAGSESWGERARLRGPSWSQRDLLRGPRPTAGSFPPGLVVASSPGLWPAEGQQLLSSDSPWGQALGSPEDRRPPGLGSEFKA